MVINGRFDYLQRMKRFLHIVMMLILVTATTMTPSVSAFMPAAPATEMPCSMHTGGMAAKAATPSCDDCKSLMTLCQGAGCGCCYPAALVAASANPQIVSGSAPPLLQAHYTSVMLSLDSPPPRPLLY
jgi:hypothetical protein